MALLLSPSRFGALGFLLLASGCPSASPEKSEAAVVNRGVTALRDADNAQKHEVLAVLRATPCETADICAVRSACLAAYELHVESLARLAGVAARDAAPEPADLDAVKSELGRARELASKCTDLQGEMVRRYKL
jgi:hypothetical protein